MHYDTLLFNMDNTLLDFDANEAESFRGMLREKGEPSSGELFSTYEATNEQVWQTIERDEATISEMLNTRFSRLMSKYGKQVDGMGWENCYRSYLDHDVQEVPGVHQTLKQLKKRFRLHVIANSVEETQHYKLEGVDMMEYFDGVFISQSIRAEKPTKGFFDYARGHIENFDAGHSLVIGDSLTSDILGGQMAGMDTCWFYRKEGENLLDEKPTCVIHDLQDLLEMLER